MALLSIHFSGKFPIYEEIANCIEEMVLGDMLEQNEQLPSVRELANDLAVNPNTIQKAYSELEGRGITYSLYGKGNFITENIEKIRQNKLNSLSKQLEEYLHKYQLAGGSKEFAVNLVNNIFKKEEEEH